LRNGILTAPVLFALEEYEKKNENKDALVLRKLINNKFKDKKDFSLAMNLVLKSDGVSKSRELAKYYIAEAVKALDVIEDSIYKNALTDLAIYTIKREF